MNEADARHLSHALRLGARGLGRTWPNPAVGCVIVKAGRVVGRGWTQPGGRPHAEAMALAGAGAAARGATAYVSLEPCAHHGKTPPCADALVAAGVVRVVTPMADPDPRVAGRGLTRLRGAGVEVVVAEAARAAAERAHAGFLMRQRAGRPFVTLKLATSLDGRIATGSGESRWITGAEARRAVHLMRARHDAVLVGAGTARADDPMLDVRGLGLAAMNPVRVVLDARLSLPADGRLGRSADAVPLWLLHGPDAPPGAWAGTAAERIACPLVEGRIDLAAALQALGARGLTSVLCEGGGTLAASLLTAGLVDRLVLMQAGLALGAEGVPGLGPLPALPLADHGRWRRVEARASGADLLSVWDPA